MSFCQFLSVVVCKFIYLLPKKNRMSLGDGGTAFSPLSLSPPSPQPWVLNCGVTHICDGTITPNTCNCRTWAKLP